MNTDKNTQNNDKPKISSMKKRLAYGSVATGFTIVFIAIILIVNLITTGYNNKNPMMIDMTKEQIFTLSDVTKNLLKDITTPVEIAFFMPLDKYEDLSGEYSRMIVNCAKEFASNFPNIKIVVEDPLKDPSVKTKYYTSNTSQLQTTTVAVHSGNTSSNIAISGFFTTDSSTGNMIAFNGEKKIAAAILQVTSTDSPTVYFTTGHGEASYPALEDLFIQSGYVIKNIDLTMEEIDPESKILVICNPQKDFIGAAVENQTEKSEIEKIASFLNDFGNVMYFTSPNVGALPEIDDLLKEYGIVFAHNTVAVDTKNSIAGSSGYALTTQYITSSDGSSAGDELHKSIRSLPSLPKSVMYNAKPIEIANNSSDKKTVPVLSSFDTTTVYSSNDVLYQGVVPLMVLSQSTRYVNNEPQTALLLACGSADSFNEVVLANTSYANSDIILNAIRIMGNRKVPVDIKFKRFESFTLDMTIEESNNLTIVSIILLPTLVIALGLVVWLKRRHS